MSVERRPDPIAAVPAHLVMAAHARQFDRRSPIFRVRPALEIQFPPPGVAGEHEKKLLVSRRRRPREIPDLRVSERRSALRRDPLERFDAVGFVAPVDDAVAARVPPRNEDVNVALPVELDRRVVVRIVHASFIHHDRRTWHPPGDVIGTTPP